MAGGIGGKRGGEGVVVVIGDVMADIAIRPHPGPSIRFGSDTPSEIRLGVGGTGANTAIHLARRGRRPVLIGRVGDDELGSFVAGRLSAEGVAFPGDGSREGKTGAIGILVDRDGQRTMFPQEGANAAADGPFVRKHWPAEEADVAALFVSGYSLFRPSTRPGARWAIARARAAGIPIFVDPASYGFLSDAGPRRFLRWVEGATVLLPNRQEAGVLVGAAHTLDRKGCRRAAARLAERFPVVVVTMDRDGALARAGEKTWHEAALPAIVVDTTGAGDAFNGAFVAAYTVRRDVAAALAAGNRAAAEVVGRIGPT